MHFFFSTRNWKNSKFSFYPNFRSIREQENRKKKKKNISTGGWFVASNSESESRAFASCFFCRKRKWSKNPWAKKCVRYGGEVGKWISSGEREDGVSSLCKLTAHPGQRGLRASYPFSFFFSFPFLFVFSFSRPVRSPRNNHGACKKFHHPSSIHLFPLDSFSSKFPRFPIHRDRVSEKFQNRYRSLRKLQKSIHLGCQNSLV